MKIVFLYTELADYFLKCCEELSKVASIHIVRWPVNKEAPFSFNFPNGVAVYEKNNYALPELKLLVEKINPDLIVCSGWIDKDYLKIVKPFFKKIPTIISCDTHWRGDLKQQIARVLGRIFLKTRFSHAWVPGEAQFTYMEKLGFKPSQIHKNFYCCDLERFNTIYEENAMLKQNDFPKVFLYVGRYYEFKGISDLWNAFIQLQNENPNNWELWCLGKGSIEPVVHPKIKHFGFVQPNDLNEIIKKSGVFILPSKFEPWGVVVQEYAAAGFPLILSDAVGAKEVFLEPNQNGYEYAANNIFELKNQLKKITDINSKELNLMSERSHQLAQKINKAIWSSTLIKIYNEFKQN